MRETPIFQEYQRLIRERFTLESLTNYLLKNQIDLPQGHVEAQVRNFLLDIQPYHALDVLPGKILEEFLESICDKNYYTFDLLILTEFSHRTGKGVRFGEMLSAINGYFAYCQVMKIDPFESDSLHRYLLTC